MHRFSTGFQQAPVENSVTRTLVRVTLVAWLAFSPLASLLAAPDLLAPIRTGSGPSAGSSGAVDLLLWLGGGLVVFGAIRIKDTATLATKWVRNAGNAAGDYKSGVEQAGADWETGAKNGETNFEQGVQDAIAKKRYGRGISAAGAGKYTANASKLGAVRYAPGVQNAQEAWSRGVQPALDKLKSLTLPPKGPRRSPQNQQRAAMVAIELGKLKDAS